MSGPGDGLCSLPGCLYRNSPVIVLITIDNTMTRADADTASLYSTTETLVDLPVLNQGASSSGNSSEHPSGSHLVLYTTYDGSVRDQEERLSRAGFATTSARGTSSTGINPLSSLKKRLVTQCPLSELQRPCDLVPDAQNGDEMQKRLDGRPTGRSLGTMYQWQYPELISIRRRTRMSLVLAALYKAPDVRDVFALYPNDRLVHCPQGLLEKKTGEAKVAMQYATITVTAPSSSSSPSSSEAFYAAHPTLSPTHRETGQEVYERVSILAPASQQTEDHLSSLLEYLESRGALWTDAGVDVRPSLGRAEPKTQDRFVVLGLLPVPLFNRLKKSRTLVDDPKSLPLIVRKGNEEGSAQGDKSGADKAPSALDSDSWRDWSVSLHREPFITGTPTSVGASMAVPGAFGVGTF